MRAFLVALPLVFCASPVVAQTAPAPFRSAPVRAVQAPEHSRDLAGSDGIDLSNLSKLANVARTASNAVLDMKVGSIQPALEGREPTSAERNLTIRDLAHRRDPDFERHVDQKLAAAVPKIEQSVKAINEALPEVEQSLAKAKQSIKRAMANMPDPDYPRR